MATGNTPREYGAWTLLGICFFIHLSSSLVGWNRELTDQHGFRQCQTAISVYYTVHDGFRLAYETPVLGKPWAIPEEFPLFQWIVAAAVLTFKTPIDQTGRFFSLLFFYLSLFPVYSLLRYFTRERSQRLLLIGLILLNPIYLFWSRAFLIESLALFLSALYLLTASKALEPGAKKGWRFLLATLFGTLAGLVKITTFAAFGLPAACLLVWSWRQEGPSRIKFTVVWKYLAYAGVLFIIPFTLSWEWIRFSDDLKRLNPMSADFLTSQALVAWTFGTLDQKWSLDVWRQMFGHTHLLSLFGDIYCGFANLSLLLVALLASLFFLPGKRTGRVLCLVFYLLPLLVFTNLFFIHDYYSYSNNLFLVILTGLTLLAIPERFGEKGAKTLTRVLILLFAIVSYSDYVSAYAVFNPPLNAKHGIDQITHIIKEHTKESDVLLVYGLNDDPSIPYYSGRRALMDPWGLPLNDPKMEKALANLKDDPIGAMLTFGFQNRDFIKERVGRFKLNPIPLETEGYCLYSGKGL
jgi:hypothetical protein